MNNSHKVVEYELIGIEWELQYDLSDATPIRMVKDESDQMDSSQPAIDYDENGIPMGNTPEETKIRKKIIFDFYENWKTIHPNKSVFNKSLNADILIRKESVVETSGHSARTYRSTLAVLNLDEILANAQVVGYDNTKQNNKNQAKMSKMILMSYLLNEIGIIKLTVGVRRNTDDKVQYGITAMDKDQEITPIVDSVAEKKKKHLKK